MNIKLLAGGAISIVIAAAAWIAAGLAPPAVAQSGPSWGPQWTADGDLILPENFRQWIFLGSPLTPNALNNGQAGFPEYHNVYVRPEALDIYRRTGTWPEGTIMLKELQLTQDAIYPDGSRDEASGRGFFPGALNGIDISVKDSVRFKDSKGWGFFNFGHHAPPYAKEAKAQPVEACAGCHMGNPNGMVFSQFYAPILDAK